MKNLRVVCRSVTNHQTAAHSRLTDCLYLNLWVPKTGEQLSTMIFMHGVTSGTDLGQLFFMMEDTAQDAMRIIITINYRTGTETKARSEITISGQSAGAQSVGVHLVSEESRDLFDQALMFSNPYSLPFKLLDDGVALGKGVANLIGCPDVFDLDCWRAVSAEDLLAASRQATSAIYNPNEILQIFEPWSPAVGPYTELPEEVMIVNQQGAAQKKPTMLGTVREEGWPYITGIFRNELGNLQYRLFLKAIIPPYYRELINLYPADNTRDADQRNILSDTCTDFIFYCPSINISLSMSDQGYDNFYFYVLNSAWSFEEEWTEKYKDCWGHVCHGGDLPYIFRSGPLGNVSYSPGETEMMNHMTAYISNFLHTGDPNIPGRTLLRYVLQRLWWKFGT
ncbi:putative crystal protein-like [Apostichopus japonicus]|uniref:Putative crystal protein-like n=1 Tax=Stichopus japonicus TaxID=307972 RepID=A0A2G8JDR2_STIJA|nr:putative crystal protein-like [Apostichopus japonicus]